MYITEQKKKETGVGTGDKEDGGKGQRRMLGGGGGGGWRRGINKIRFEVSQLDSK